MFTAYLVKVNAMAKIEMEQAMNGLRPKRKSVKLGFLLNDAVIRDEWEKMRTDTDVRDFIKRADNVVGHVARNLHIVEIMQAEGQKESRGADESDNEELDNDDDNQLSPPNSPGDSFEDFSDNQRPSTSSENTTGNSETSPNQQPPSNSSDNARNHFEDSSNQQSPSNLSENSHDNSPHNTPINSPENLPENFPRHTPANVPHRDSPSKSLHTMSDKYANELNSSCTEPSTSTSSQTGIKRKRALPSSRDCKNCDDVASYAFLCGHTFCEICQEVLDVCVECERRTTKKIKLIFP